MEVITMLITMGMSRKERFYSPSPEYLITCCRDEWKSEHAVALRGKTGCFGGFGFDIPQRASGSFID